MKILNVKCRKCDSSELYAFTNGPHMELRCCNCGKFVKFANKDEKKFIANEVKEIES